MKTISITQENNSNKTVKRVGLSQKPSSLSFSAGSPYPKKTFTLSLEN